MTAPTRVGEDTRMSGPEELLSIGVFARRSLLSMKALRLYDRWGLLRPAHVDPATGRRRYRESQLFTARLIVLLRQLDMPLAEVAQVVAAPGEVGAQRLVEYWDEIERRRTAQSDLVQRLRLSMLGGADRFGSYTVYQREVPDQLVLTEQRHLRPAELSGWLAATKARLVSTAQEFGGVVGQLYVIFHGAVTEDSDGPVEVCVPIDPGQSESTRVPMRREPAHREAYVRITKAQFELPQILSGYDAVEQWMREQRRCCIGSPREIYYAGVDVRAAAMTDEVCDVAYPIR